MSRDNAETARRLLGAVAERDLATLLELTDPEVRWRSFFAALSEGGEYHGHDALPRYLEDLGEAFELLRPDDLQFLDLGDLVVGVGRIYYRGKGSGIETEAAAGWVFRFRSGKAVLFRAFQDPERALDAVGL